MLFTGWPTHCETSLRNERISCVPVYTVSQPAGCFRVTVEGHYKCLCPHVAFELYGAWRKDFHETKESLLPYFR